MNLINMPFSTSSLPKELESTELFERGKEFLILMNWYQCAMMEVETKLRVLDSEFSVQYDRNPIESITTRLKNPLSIAQKLMRRELDINIQNIEDNLFDVAGIRVVCDFIEDIYSLEHLLLQQDDITLIRRKDYIAHPKPNGYRSLHLIVAIPIFLSTEKKIVNVEVQFRTIAMDFWASVEHKLKYKKHVANEERIVEKLRECSESIALIDRQMQEIRREIDASRKE